MTKRQKQIVMQFSLLAAVFLASMGIFTLSYRYDNKYTAKATQPIGGILFYDPDLGPVHLINGWEYYKGRLLSPDDWNGTASPLPDGHLAIGQYLGMETGSRNVSPHGSITYRLTVCLPDTSAFYTLELPEIYSAYRLYLNGRLAMFQGNPDREAYAPSLKAGSLTFEASGDVTLLLAVSDWSHLYSGLVYPPVFGPSSMVQTLLDQKFVWGLAAVTLALVLGLFQLVLAVLLRNRRSLFSGLICAAFAGSVSSPVIHRLTATGIVPFYNLEIFCRYAIYGLASLLTAELCRTSGERTRRITAAISLTAAAFPLAALAVPLLAPGLSAGQMILFSNAAGIYKILCSLWLLAAVFYTGLGTKQRAGNSLLLAGICVFSSSLAADRLYPDFEPIRLGWFSETAGLLFVLILSVLMLRDSAILYKSQFLFAQQKKYLEQEIVMQKRHYLELTGQMETIRTMRHDIRHHLNQLSGFLDDGNPAAARTYLARLTQSSLTASPLSFCDAYYVDVLLRFYDSKAKELQTPFTVDAKLLQDPAIPEEDLCVILGNLLENGLDACRKIPAAGRFLSVTLLAQNSSFAIEVQNSYSGVLIPDGDSFYSAKEKNRRGIGLSSVRQTCEKYGGALWIKTRPGDNGIHTFLVQVLIHSGRTPGSVRAETEDQTFT